MPAKRFESAIPVLKDLRLFYNDNNLIIFIILALILTGPMILGQWKGFMCQRDRDTIYSDKDVKVVEGEYPAEANFNYIFKGNNSCFGQRQLHLYTTELTPQGYFSFKYTMHISRDGVYKIFLAGSPPGAATPSNNDTHFSPFEMILDNRKTIEFTEESKEETLFRETGTTFYSFYEYFLGGHRFTKLGEFALKKGNHVIEFRVSKKRLTDDYYVMFADAIFIVPKDWKQKRKFFTLPEDLFLY